MRIIELDAAKWKSVLDFYVALLAALGAPHWHGMNINALIDSMVWGGINEAEPPYTVRIHNLHQTQSEVAEEVLTAAEAIKEARNDRRARGRPDADVTIEAAD